MGRLLPLILFELGKGNLIPSRDVRSANIMLGEGTDHLTPEFCRVAHLPPMDFARFDNTCSGMTDTDIVDGTTCQYECIDYQNVGSTHNVTCECRASLTDPGVGHDVCGWVFQGDDADNTYQCGKSIVRQMFLDNKENYVRIRKNFYDTSRDYLDAIETLHLDLHGWTDLHLATVESLYKDTEDQIEERKEEDQ